MSKKVDVPKDSVWLVEVKKTNAMHGKAVFALKSEQEARDKAESGAWVLQALNLKASITVREVPMGENILEAFHDPHYPDSGKS